MYRIHLAQNTLPNGRQRAGVPQFSVMADGDYLSFVGSKEKRRGIPGRRIVFCGKRKSRRLYGDDDFKFSIPTGKTISANMNTSPIDMPPIPAPKKVKAGKAAKKKSVSVSKKVSAVSKKKILSPIPKSKALVPVKKASSKKIAKQSKKSFKKVAPSAARKKSVREAGTRHPDKYTRAELEDIQLFVQTNKNILRRDRLGNLTTTKETPWTMRQARKVAKSMGFGYSRKTGKLHKMTALHGKRRKRRLFKFKGLPSIVGGKRKRRSVCGYKKRKLSGRKKYHIAKMRKLYGRRRNRSLRLRGLTDDKPILFGGLAVGGGIAYLLKGVYDDRIKEGKLTLPESLQTHENETYAVAMLLIGVLLTFSDKIGAVKAKPKLANALKAGGVGLALGTLVTFAKEKFSTPTDPAVSGRFRGGLRGRLYGRLGGGTSQAFNAIQPNLQSGTLGVRTLGQTTPSLSGGVFQVGSGAATPSQVMGGSVNQLVRGQPVRVVRGVVQLNGAANLENSVQTGLTDAEYGL